MCTAARCRTTPRRRAPATCRLWRTPTAARAWASARASRRRRCSPRVFRRLVAACGCRRSAGLWYSARRCGPAGGQGYWEMAPQGGHFIMVPQRVAYAAALSIYKASWHNDVVMRSLQRWSAVRHGPAKSCGPILLQTECQSFVAEGLLGHRTCAEVVEGTQGLGLVGPWWVGRLGGPLILATTACAWARSHGLRLHWFCCSCGCLCICERVASGSCFQQRIGRCYWACGLCYEVCYKELRGLLQGGRSVQQCRHVYEKRVREHMAIGACIPWEQPASIAQSICMLYVPSFCTCLGGISMCR